MIKKTTKDLILGIDPGLTGALAILDAETLFIVDILDVPTYHTKTSSRKSGKVSNIDMFSLVSSLRPYKERIIMAIIEEPGAMPGQGLGSTFKFGKVCGQLEGIIAGLDIPIHPIKPSVWKLALGLEASKDSTLSEVKRLYPNQDHHFKRKKDHDRAEAVLLARFATTHLRAFMEFCV